MAIFAHVTNGMVTNMIVAEDEEVALEVAPTGAIAVDVSGAPCGIGWTWDGDTPIPPIAIDPES